MADMRSAIYEILCQILEALERIGKALEDKNELLRTALLDDGE